MLLSPLIFQSLKNKFKKRKDLYPRIVKRKITSLMMNLSVTSRVSILNQYQIFKLLTPLFSYSQAILTKHGSNTLRLLISQSAPKYGRTINVVGT